MPRGVIKNANKTIKKIDKSPEKNNDMTTIITNSSKTLSAPQNFESECKIDNVLSTAPAAPAAAQPPPQNLETQRKKRVLTRLISTSGTVDTPVAAQTTKKNINKILNREKIAEDIKSILLKFNDHRDDNMFKKGIYIYGNAGSGKTEFIMSLLREMNFDIIKYDTGDVRNKSLIDTITKNNMSDRNVLSMMRGEQRKIAVVMDEIDGMNNGDKGGITALIKVIRQKKTKKQKLEDVTVNPIICIGNYHTDKKIRELMKVCNTFELKNANDDQIRDLLQNDGIDCTASEIDNIVELCQGDLRKYNFYSKLYRKTPQALKICIENKYFQCKTYNDNTKKITETLINYPSSIENHNIIMNETDRTMVALLWHENIVDAIEKKTDTARFSFYMKVLDNICFSDYIDRITFQNQIWQFNEMTSLIKTFHNNKIYHDTFPENRGKFICKKETTKKTAVGSDNFIEPDIRFTKVLTKYSTEYNNILFIYNLCQKLDMDQKDVLSFFQELRNIHGDISGDNEIMFKIEKIFEKYEINKLYIKRIYRYLDKNVKKDATNDEDLEDEDCDED